jgi:hypothetical protein
MREQHAHFTAAPVARSMRSSRSSGARVRAVRRCPSQLPIAARRQLTGSWVTSTRVVPSSRLSSNSRSATRSPVAVSRLPVGSSANSNARFTGKGAGDRHALLLAAGELPRVVVRAPPGRRAPGIARPRRGTAVALQLERQHHVFQRRERGQQLEGLEHKADVARAHGARPSSSRSCRDPYRRCDTPLARPIQAGEQPSSVDLPDPEAPMIATFPPT